MNCNYNNRRSVYKWLWLGIQEPPQFEDTSGLGELDVFTDAFADVVALS
jgi:hypothetical protein